MSNQNAGAWVCERIVVLHILVKKLDRRKLGKKFVLVFEFLLFHFSFGPEVHRISIYGK